MLPAHLNLRHNRRRHGSDDDEGDSAASANRRTYQSSSSLPRPPPSLCITGALCTMGFAGRVSYKIFRPRQMKPSVLPPAVAASLPSFAAPLIVVHGGPSIPCNYLLPLVGSITDRAIVLYDQFGCGRSPRPAAGSKFSLSDAVEDLNVLLQTLQSSLNMNSFHLYGHSFGGILAYEYLRYKQKQQQVRGEIQQREVKSESTGIPSSSAAQSVTRSDPKCLSLTLASTPASTDVIREESKRLLVALQEEHPDEFVSPDDEDDDESDRAQSFPNETLSSLSIDPASTAALMTTSSAVSLSQTQRNMRPPERLTLSQEFSRRHECRLEQWPISLLDAYSQAGPVSWRGMAALEKYPTNTEEEDNVVSCSGFPPTMLMRGQYDFCTEACMQPWTKLLPVQQINVLAQCSHYGMLEDENKYGIVLSVFLQQQDRDEK